MENLENNNPDVFEQSPKPVKVIENIEELSQDARVSVPLEYIKAVESLESDNQKGEALFLLKLCYAYSELFDLKCPDLSLPEGTDFVAGKKYLEALKSQLAKITGNDRYGILSKLHFQEDDFDRYTRETRRRLRKLSDSGENRQVEVLEVGAGGSYEVYANTFSVPRYSRAVKAVYGDKVSITASDIRPDQIRDGFVVFKVDSQGILHFVGREEIGMLDDLNLEDYQKAKLSGSFDFPSGSSGVYQDETGKYRFVPLPSEQIKRIAKKDEPVSERYYIRPPLDPLFEKLAFDINAQGKVDMFKLKEYFPDKKFDYVFGSMLLPSTQDKDYKCMKNVLAEGGKLSVFIADSELASNPYEYDNPENQSS